jgi:NTE family protein
LLLWALVGWAQVPAARPGDSPLAATDRPVVALVLSGGGARGLAHIGVLRALRELDVPVDMVVGTSMGSVVGGAYAAGRSVDELEAIVRTIAWDRVLSDRPPRDRLPLRRREEYLILPSRLDFSLGRGGLSLPPATAGNSALEQVLQALVPEGFHERPANALGLPFLAVAADLLTGDLVELSDAPLTQAMRASMSVPGVFAPVRLQGRVLVDGGLVRNLPVDLARAMGAQVIIAVNLGTSLAAEDSLGTSLGVAQQMLTLLTEQNVQRSLKELGPSDVLISPELRGLGFLDFAEFERAFVAGHEATLALADRLRALAVPKAVASQRDSQRTAPGLTTDQRLPLGRITVTGTQRIHADALIADAGLSIGQVMGAEEVREAAARLYGRPDIAGVETTLTAQDGQQHLTLQVKEADWAHSRVRLGLQLRSDFADENSFGIRALHVASSLNSWGAELRTVVNVGTQRQLSAEWWQPLGPGSPWHLSASLSYEAASQDLYVDRRTAARVGVRGTGLDLSAGYRLGHWGEVRLGYGRSVGTSKQLIPADPAATATFAANYLVAQLRADTMDPIAFPIKGHLIDVSWTRPLHDGNGANLSPRSEFTGLRAFSWGAWGGHVYGEWAHASSGDAGGRLGGFLRLSGTNPQSVDGNTVLFGRLVLARRVGALPVFLGDALRAGFSVEFGNGVAAGQALQLADLKLAGSVFLALDTRFGPFYLGAGTTLAGSGTYLGASSPRGSSSRAYLFLGPIW